MTFRSRRRHRRQESELLRGGEDPPAGAPHRRAPPALHLLPRGVPARQGRPAGRPAARHHRLHVAPPAEGQPAGDRLVRPAGVGRPAPAELLRAPPRRPAADDEVGRRTQAALHRRAAPGQLRTHARTYGGRRGGGGGGRGTTDVVDPLRHSSGD